MKASTAAHILRAARSRLGEQGFVQLGSKELIALEFAYQHTPHKLFKEMEFMACTAMAAARQTKKPVCPTFLQQHYEALRVAYKTLEQLPSDAEFTVSALDPTPGDPVEEAVTPPTGDWYTPLGLNEEEIKALKNKPKDDDTTTN